MSTRLMMQPHRRPMSDVSLQVCIVDMKQQVEDADEAGAGAEGDKMRKTTHKAAANEVTTKDWGRGFGHCWREGQPETIFPASRRVQGGSLPTPASRSSSHPPGGGKGGAGAGVALGAALMAPVLGRRRRRAHLQSPPSARAASSRRRTWRCTQSTAPTLETCPAAEESRPCNTGACPSD